MLVSKYYDVQKILIKGNAADQDMTTVARLSYLDNIRAIAIIMVVGVHAIDYCITLPPDQLKIISFIVKSIAVPIFFFVDGYLLANAAKSGKYNYQRIIRNSIFRLLVPWFIFTIMYTILRYVFESAGVLEYQVILGRSWSEVLISAYGSVFALQMYFLVSLFYIRILSPILKHLYIDLSLLSALLLFVFYVAIYIMIKPTISAYLEIEHGLEPLLHAFWGVQFYILGIMVFRANERVDSRLLFSIVLVAFCVALGLQVTTGILSKLLVQYLYLLSIFYLFLSVNKEMKILKSIGKNTMGIYLLHLPIIIKIVSLIVNKFVFTPIVSYVVIMFLTTLISYYVVVFINRIPYGSILFGIRYRKSP